MLEFFIHLYPFVFKHFGKIHSTDASFGIAFPMHIHLFVAASSAVKRHSHKKINMSAFAGYLWKDASAFSVP